MAGTATGKIALYALEHALKAGVHWTSDTIKMVLLSTTPTKNWQYYSTVTHEFTSGGGYTKGGLTLSSCTISVTKANTWGVSRAATTAYKVNQLVRPASANGYIYRCVVAGTSGASLPSYPTVVGETVTDGGVRWVNAGESATVITSTKASWTPLTLTGIKGAVIVDAQSGTHSTEPVIAVITPTTPASPQAGLFTLTPDPHSGWAAWTPA